MADWVWPIAAAGILTVGAGSAAVPPDAMSEAEDGAGWQEKIVAFSLYNHSGAAASLGEATPLSILYSQ